MKYKIFGERNTGTNALLQMLKINSKSKFYPGTLLELSPIIAKQISFLKKGGLEKYKQEQMIDNIFMKRSFLESWKHSATNFIIDRSLEESRFIFTVRNPMSWLVGLYRKPHHILIEKPKNLISFSQIRWKTLGRENVSLKFYKPLDLLEEKLKSYISLMDQLEKHKIKYRVIKFENFVSNQHETFNFLKNFLDSPSILFTELAKSTSDQNLNSKYYSNYYNNEVWREEFPEVDSIKNTISKNILSVFGYK